MNSLDRFGDDLCEELLSYLSLEDKFRFECISKQWRRVVFESQTVVTIDGNTGRWFHPMLGRVSKAELKRKMEYKPTIDYPLEDTAIELLVKYCSHLTTIYMNFKNISVDTIDKFFTKFGPKLKSVNVFGFNESVDQKWIEKWLKMCVNMQSFTNNDRPLYNVMIQLVPKIPVLFKRLNSIRLDVHTLDEDINGLMTALDVFADKYGHQMKTIGLIVWSSNAVIIDAILTQLMDSLPRMQTLISFELSFTADSQVSSEDWIQLLTTIGINCRQMKSLDINRLTLSNIVVGEEPLTSNLLQPLRRLTHLYLLYMT
ncbi:unnamed protein product [Medioppia subpectinata]|uniref:F-box domain-containing protein n=1 Tax=Medioppia subpectinata TaxID=1979941 RepID=A0A7R9QFR5_9ACAR|nr:unnamed protein product [Medioppia subpectinata]CAG2119536.1 unnamed protein product [Medioppia subpectinata]